MNYNEYANQVIERLKPTFEQIRDIGNQIKVYPNKLDKIFYLSMQDELSNLYDIILEYYVIVKSKVKEAEALVYLALKESYETQNKKMPNTKTLESEVVKEIKDIMSLENILESWYKIIKNYLQTCRSHINAITGREIENQQ